MKMLRVATMLLASATATKLAEDKDLDDKETKLSQSFASAFNMEPPKLMTTDPLPEASKGGCPKAGTELTSAKSGGAFLDGCYMNTTRSQARNEATGEEAQSYLYMWKHACAFTKWVPSNQFMYSNLDYDANTMTLERFGFIGMEKRCFWGSIGVLWKRPLPVEQILPNTTIEVKPTIKPQPKPAPKKEKPKGPKMVQQGQLGNKKFAKGDCLGVKGNTILVEKCGKNDNIWQEFADGTIKHKQSGKCMATSAKKWGTPIVLAKCNGKKVQQWSEKKTKGKYFLIESDAYKGICVDLPGHKGNRGLRTQNYKCISSDGDNFQYTWM